MELLNQMDGFDRLGQVKTGQENWSVRDRDKITTVATLNCQLLLFWWLEIPLPNEPSSSGHYEDPRLSHYQT